MSSKAYLLIARKGGSSSSRRQRAFDSQADVDRAVLRWKAEGFDTWWLFGAKNSSGHRVRMGEWRSRVEEPTHPKTGEPTNQARAARVDEAIQAYAVRVYGNQADRDDLATVAQDFLTDVYHWMREHGLDPDDIVQRAANMAQEEAADERRA